MHLLGQPNTLLASCLKDSAEAGFLKKHELVESVRALERLAPFLMFAPVTTTEYESVWIQPGIQPYEPVKQICVGSI